MQSDLEQIIQALLQERQSLQVSVDQALKDADYQAACWHQKGLVDINLRLQTLYVFQNRDYLKTCELERAIAYAENNIDNQAQPAFMAHYYRERLEEDRQELESLKKSGPASKFDGQELDDALFALANREIESFNLFLQLRGCYTSSFHTRHRAGYDRSLLLRRTRPYTIRIAVRRGLQQHWICEPPRWTARIPIPGLRIQRCLGNQNRSKPAPLRPAGHSPVASGRTYCIQAIRQAGFGRIS